MQKILIVDDDIDMCFLLNMFLTRKGYRVDKVHSGEAANEYFEASAPDLVICDLRLGDIDGITLLQQTKAQYPHIPFVMITAYDDLKLSATALKYGALDYITKPLLPEQIASIVELAFEKVKDRKHTSTENRSALVEEVTFFSSKSDSFERIEKQINLVAPTNYNVIIHGESGTGKDAVAREIHHRSNRAKHQFKVLNCSALSGELIQVELFGNALTGKKGALEIANGGTVYLDEMAHLPIYTQTKLLDALNQRKLLINKGLDEIELDIRILAASHESLWQATHKGLLHEALYHKINDFTIDLLPLRNRKDDILTFAHHFLSLANEAYGTSITSFSPEVELIFKNYVWNDNLRELKTVVDKAVLLTKTTQIEVEALPVEIAPGKKINIATNTIATDSNLPSSPFLGTDRLFMQG